jgi:hypothetical protein
MRKLVFPLVFTLTIAGCATPQSQLQAGLMDAGLSRNQAGCMAERMDDKLSLGQLMKIRSLKNVGKERIADTSVSRFLRNIRALNDPEIVSVTTRAALGCAISG